MDPGRMMEMLLRMEHRHDDGTWSPLEPRPQHHDPADHDPERAWADGQLYACPTCEGQVIVRAIGEKRD